MSTRPTLICLAVVALFSGCASNPTKRVDSDATENVTIGFGRTDIEKIVGDAMTKLLTSRPNTEWARKTSKTPYVMVGKVRNRTDEHVDTKNVTDMLRSRLQESGTIRFTTDRDKRKETLDEVQLQEDSGAYKGGAKLGNWIPPEYILNGRFGSIRKKTDTVEDVYYVFVLKLEHINTATIAWQCTTEIAKVKTKAGAGW
jgi:penicillin-binding protein activator